jgi:hypothetical protein
MATVTAQAYSTEADIATTLDGLIGTVTTYYSTTILRLGTDRYLIVVAYDGT